VAIQGRGAHSFPSTWVMMALGFAGFGFAAKLHKGKGRSAATVI
jgi:hypothetical protein